MVRELFNLFFTFFKIGCITFGGGYAMLPILERELETKRHWTTSSELLDYYAIAQSTPGIIAVNVATFIGYKRRKISGSIFSTLGLITPALIIITVIALFVSNFEKYEIVQHALKGINVAVAALLTNSIFKLCKKNFKNIWSVILFALSFSAIYFFHIHTAIIIPASFVMGIATHFIFNRKNFSQAENSPSSSSANKEEQE